MSQYAKLGSVIHETSRPHLGTQSFFLQNSEIQMIRVLCLGWLRDEQMPLHIFMAVPRPGVDCFYEQKRHLKLQYHTIPGMIPFPFRS